MDSFTLDRRLSAAEFLRIVFHLSSGNDTSSPLVHDTTRSFIVSKQMNRVPRILDTLPAARSLPRCFDNARENVMFPCESLASLKLFKMFPLFTHRKHVLCISHRVDIKVPYDIKTTQELEKLQVQHSRETKLHISYDKGRHGIVMYLLMHSLHLRQIYLNISCFYLFILIFNVFTSPNKSGQVL